MKLLGKHKIREILRAYRPLICFPTQLRDAEIVILEMEPQIRTIRWAEQFVKKPSVTYTYCWQLPYLQFFYTCGYLGIASSPISIDYELGYDCFYRSPLPNVFDSGFVCQKKAKNLNDAIGIFFGSYFEPPGNWILPSKFLILAGWDYNSKSPTSVNYSVALSEWWQQKSKDDPDFVLSINFIEMGRLYCANANFPGSLLPFLQGVERKSREEETRPY